MRDLSSLPRIWPRTAAALESLGAAWDAGELPESVDEEVAQAAVVLRTSRRHTESERRAALRLLAQRGGDLATALLTEALLRESTRELRDLALRQLCLLPGRAVDGAAALGLVDPSRKMVRETAQRLLVGRGPAAFVVIYALWEDRAGDRATLAEELAACAERSPRVGMRRVLPTLEREGRWIFASVKHRATHQACVRRIEAATAPLKDLPVAASAAPGNADADLPLPASAPDAVARIGRRAWWRRLFLR